MVKAKRIPLANDGYHRGDVMEMLKSAALILSLAAFAMCAASSLARSEELEQDHRLSTGFALGKTTSNYDSGSYAGTPQSKDTSGSLFLEYDFTKYIGLQTAWWLLAIHDSSDITVGSTTYSGVTREVSGFTVDGVGLLPLGHGFKLLGKAGAFFWRGETSGCGDLFCNSFQGTTLDKSNGVSFTWGVGARWDFSNSVGVRVDYDNFGQVYNAKMQTISVGFYVLFF
jgi:opacity protein-like surface antigen